MIGCAYLYALSYNSYFYILCPINNPLEVEKVKSKNKSKKSQAGESIVFKTKRSLAVLDRREKNNNERIVKLQKRIDAVSKLGLEMQALKEKQKQIATLKETRIDEIKSLVEAFGSSTPAENPQV